jgi:spore coat protein A
MNACTLWYHDHAIGITRLNIYAGLAGFYLVRSEKERCLNMPSGKYDIPLLLQDRTFNQDGSLYYPRQPDEHVHELETSIVPEFFGKTILVNGKVWPFVGVEPRKYRFRILNGSNSRFFRLRLDRDQLMCPTRSE